MGLRQPSRDAEDMRDPGALESLLVMRSCEECQTLRVRERAWKHRTGGSCTTARCSGMHAAPERARGGYSPRPRDLDSTRTPDAPDVQVLCHLDRLPVFSELLGCAGGRGVSAGGVASASRWTFRPRACREDFEDREDSLDLEVARWLEGRR